MIRGCQEKVLVDFPYAKVTCFPHVNPVCFRWEHMCFKLKHIFFILMLKDLYTIQLYKIYYKNIHNILPVYFQRFLPNYNNGSAHNHNLRHQALRLPMTRKEYYVQSTKYQLFKLIRETPQLDLDRCLTSSLVQFVAYFKYNIIEAYNAVCNIRNCYVCQ